MICSYCNKNQSKVLDSRDSGNSIRRRRECINCGVRFTTYEFIQAKVISVIKRDARREDFDVDKLNRYDCEISSEIILQLSDVINYLEEAEPIFYSVEKIN